jgi:hypothetical protein
VVQHFAYDTLTRGDISGQADDEFVLPGSHSASWLHFSLRKAMSKGIAKITGGEFIPSGYAAVYGSIEETIHRLK